MNPEDIGFQKYSSFPRDPQTQFEFCWDFYWDSFYIDAQLFLPVQVPVPFVDFALLSGTLIISALVMKSHGAQAWRNVLVAVGSGASIYVFYAYFHGMGKRRNFSEPLILAFLFTLGNVVAYIFLLLITHFRSGVTLQWIFNVVHQFFLIGLGIGLGILLTEKRFQVIERRWLMLIRNWWESRFSDAA